ncbi:MAG: heavy metal-associated domain-containing protein [Pseudomonadota bacterium]
MDTIELKIEGMSCGSCVNSVTHALQRVPGVGDVDVDLARGVARVSGDVKTTPAMLAALQAAGYEAAPLSVTGKDDGAPAGTRPRQGCGGGGCCCN